MPVTLFSSTGNLEFRPSRLIFRPVLIEADYVAPSSEPDEIIDPPRPAFRAMGVSGFRSGLLALFLFCLLQAAVLTPPLYIARLLPG